MPKRKTTAKKKSPSVSKFMVLTSRCGEPNQAEFYKGAASVAAAKKIANTAMMPDTYGESPKAVYVVKVEAVGKSSSDVVWG